MGLDTSGRDLLDMVRECIDDEDLGNAKDLIGQAVAQAPENIDVVSGAVNLLLYAELYSSARRAAENYHAHTGKALPPYSIPSIEEISQFEQKNRVVDDVPVFDLAAGPIRFKKQPNLEHESLFSLITNYQPIEFIEASEHRLAITQTGIKYEFKWDEIIRASIVARIISKGPRGSIFCSQKICTLEAPGRLFQFDVSSTYPDFRAVVLLRAILARYLDVEFIDERKPGFKVAKDDPIRNLKREYLIWIGMITGGFILFLLLL